VRFRISLLVGLMLGIGVLLGCHGGHRLTWDDKELAPLRQAAAAVDRASLGFTPLAPKATVRLEGPSNTYDAMLHINGKTRRTMAFRRTANGYEWIHEQEIHTGPRQYTTPDGTFYEEIILTSETERVSGVPLNQVDIDYHGADSRLVNRHDLTLAEVMPILAEWEKAVR
jgi:hypothetical protein